jgi:secreted Zn-dependent insulinase-like peptidase
MQFEFQDKSNAVNYCVSLASKMQILDESNMDQILRSNYIVDEFSHEKLKNIGDILCDPAKLNILLRAKSIESDTD